MSSSLSDAILQAHTSQAHEKLLREALKDVELIGELEITEAAFEHLCKRMRWLLAKPPSKSFFVDAIEDYPALFIVTMVFSGRYSHDETRSFWEPYAQDVWGLPKDNKFYLEMREYYAIARNELVKQFAFEFPTRKDGDIVRPIYWHTIIPAYLHDDFARWLRDQITTLEKLSQEEQSQFIKQEKTTAYIAPRLRTFLTSAETHETALALIEELLTAYQLYIGTGNNAEDIEAQFTSLIQREVWQKFIQELKPTRKEHEIPINTVRLQWVWSVEDEDWRLRVMNITTSMDQQPRWCVWADATASNPLRNNYQREELWAERQDAFGVWRVREILFVPHEDLEQSLGTVSLYDMQNTPIGEPLPVPELPKGATLIYRLTQQGLYAIPTAPSQIAAGRYLVSHNGDFYATDANHQPIAPQENYDCSEIMQDIIGHDTLEAYEFTLPLTLKFAGETHPLEATRGRYLPTPSLESQYRVEGTSPKFPPVFTHTQIQLVFPNLGDNIKALQLNVRSAQMNKSAPLKQYGIVIGHDFVVDLEMLLLRDTLASYTVDVTYGFKSRLAAPIEFSIVPHATFEWSKTDVYTPLTPPQVHIHHVNARVEIPSSVGEVKQYDNRILVEWNQLTKRECRLDIHANNTVVPVAWEIQRVYAWVTHKDFTHTSAPQVLTEENLQDTHLHLVGERNQTLYLQIGEMQYAVRLNAKGEADIHLKYDNLRDVIESQKQPVVPLALKLQEGDWVFATLHRRAAIQSMKFRIIAVAEKNEELLSIYDVHTTAPMRGKFQLTLQPANVPHPLMQIPMHDIAARFIELPANLPLGIYNITITEQGQTLYQEKLTLEKPDLLSFSADYHPEENKLIIHHEIDKRRAGTYTLAIYNSADERIHRSDLYEEESELTIQLSPDRYALEMAWNDTTLDVLTLDVTAEPSETYKPDDLNNLPEIHWILELLEDRPAHLDAQQVFALATLPIWNPDDTLVKALLTKASKADRLWSVFGNLVRLQDARLWARKHPLPPSWAILHSTLSVMLDDKVYWLFPERVFERGMTGIGKIAISTPEEGQIYGYARWVKRKEGGSRLYVFIPPEDRGSHPYSELDELDLYPAYYDSVYKQFHGARKGGIIPGEQSNGGYISDVGHAPLIAQITRGNRSLIHQYDADQSFNRNIIADYLADKTVIRRSSGSIISKGGYTSAFGQALEQFSEGSESIKNLIYTEFSQHIINITHNLTTLARTIRIPSVIALLEFIREMERQVDTASEHPLMALDRNLLILAFAARVYAIPHASQRELINEALQIPAELLQKRLYDAYLACPLLLEWALAWAEILIVHSAKTTFGETL